MFWSFLIHLIDRLFNTFALMYMLWEQHHQFQIGYLNIRSGHEIEVAIRGLL